jgi:hypothetical protein
LDRASVFSRQSIIDELKQFVPVAQNTSFTQWREADDELSHFFWQIVNGTDAWRSQAGQTTQGYYVFDAAGHLYGYLNNRDPEQLLALLRKAEARFAAAPPPRLELPDEMPTVQPSPPEGATIAQVFSRIDPLPPNVNELNAGVGRDYLWILREEVDELSRGVFPKTLTARLTRFHLWDNVRGEPDLWQRDQVREANFTATPQREGDRVRVEIGGTFDIEAPAGLRGYRSRELPPSGYEGTLEGAIDIDPKTRQVTRLELYAEGEAWGESTFTPHAPPGRFPLKIAFVLAEGRLAREVPPRGVIYGVDEYLHSTLAE